MKRFVLVVFAAMMAFAFQMVDSSEAEANSYRCRRLARKVASYKRIRASYLRSWRRCKWRKGRYSPQCRRLRRGVNRWYAKVRIARSNYRAWGCRFGWSTWSDPWAARRARYQRAKCSRLAARVRRYKRVRSSYLRSWRRCKWRKGRYSPQCRRLRRGVNRWYAKVRIARSNYRAWGCRFGWSAWSDPWAARRARRARRVRRARYQALKCRSLARQVRTYRSLRNSYTRSYNRFRCYRRSRRYSRYCRRLRGKISRYRSRVRIARNNYAAWGCRFGWKRWNNPWR